MKYKHITLFIFFLLGNLFAQQADFNISKMKYGQERQFISARMLGLGGSGVAGGDAFSALYLNPALAGKTQKWLSINGGLIINKSEEDRSFPYYDSFGGFEDYGSFSFNKNWRPALYGNVIIQIPLEFVKDAALAFGYQPFMDFNYNYLEEVRDSESKADKLLGYNIIDHCGSMYLIPAAFSFSPYEKLTVAAQLGALTGSIDSTVTIEPKVDVLSSIDKVEKTEKTLDNVPLVTTLGMHYQVNEQFAAAATVRLPYTIEFENKYSSSLADSLSKQYKQKLTYPMRLSAGIDYRFKNILEARIFIDINYEFWSDFEDDLNPDLDYNDTYSIKTGVEHIFFNKVPFRVGFCYSSLRETKNINRAVLTAGTGLYIKKIRIDFAAGISTLEYYQEDLFAESIYNGNSVFNFVDRTDMDRVKCSEFFARIDINYSFGE
jgi:long-subunit fatty acid transport protein